MALTRRKGVEVAFYLHERTAAVMHPECLTRSKRIDGGTWARDWRWSPDGAPEICEAYGVNRVAVIECCMCGTRLGTPAHPERITKARVMGL